MMRVGRRGRSNFLRDRDMKCRLLSFPLVVTLLHCTNRNNRAFKLLSIYFAFTLYFGFILWFSSSFLNSIAESRGSADASVVVKMEEPAKETDIPLIDSSEIKVSFLSSSSCHLSAESCFFGHPALVTGTLSFSWW